MKASQLYLCLLSGNKGPLTNNKKNQQGFTLIELLVVVIIIGILSAIALPSMLNQALKAREASVKSDIGAVNRSQQAYRLENSRFANDISSLNINTPSSRNDYTYSMGNTNSTLAEFKATPGSNELRAFTGCATAASAVNNTTTTTSIKSSLPGALPPSCS